MEDYFRNVIGHDTQKEELSLTLSWFNNSKELLAKGLSIPKGIILYGEPGNGKTYLLKAIKKHSPCPVLIFKQTSDNLVNVVNDLFNKAKTYEKVIIIIDEFDLLIESNHNLIRLFQDSLDGINDHDNILLITAVNNINKIPSPLLRQGRIEKQIFIPYLKDKELIDLFNYYAGLYHIRFKEEIDEISLSQALNHISCVAIKAIVNDIVLRNGEDNITNQMIYESIYNVTLKVGFINNYDNDSYLAYHEAGHAVMMNHYQQYFKINSLSLYASGGLLKGYANKYQHETYEMMLANIQVAYAGIIATKLIFHTGDSGAISDLEKARKYAYCLINKCGYHRLSDTLPDVLSSTRKESEFKKRHNEKLISSLLKHQERITYKYIKKHLDDVKRLGDLLVKKKYLTSNEVLKCLAI